MTAPTAANRAQFVYVTYISTTPEKVFEALKDPELTKAYWGLSKNVSEWKTGAKWEHQDYEDGSVKVTGKILEFDPPKKLVVTWGRPGQEDQASQVSKVTFLVEPFMGAVKLTVTHDDLDPASPAYQGTIDGWSAILSSLKTLLETGRALPMTTRRWGGKPAQRGA